MAVTTPAAPTLVAGALADLVRSKPERVAAQALLRQQRLILRRSVKRPRCPSADRAPKQNARGERFLGSVRRECLDFVLVLGEAHRRRVLREDVNDDHAARPHQGLPQRLPDPPVVPALRPGAAEAVRAVPVLGGLHHTDQRAA